MERISIKTGDVSYQLVDENGNEAGAIRFNPADPDMWKRLDEFKAWGSSLEVPAGIKDEDLVKLSDEVRQQFDKLLNRKGASNDIFKANSPIAFLENGELYFMQMLGVIATIVEKVMSERSKKAEARIDTAVADILGNE